MIVTGYLEIGLLCHIQWLRICAAMSLRIPVLFGCINILRQISRPGLLVLASDCDWCYTLQTSLRYAAFGGHVHTKDDAAGATYFILHLTVNQGSDGLLGACLITTYDCDMTSITAPSLAIRYFLFGCLPLNDCDHLFSNVEICGLSGVGGSVSQVSANSNQIGALRMSSMTTNVFWYTGACLIIPMIVTWEWL